MPTSAYPRMPYRRRGGRRLGPLGGGLAALAIIFVLGVVWVGYAATNERHPSEPAILQSSAASVVAGQAPPGASVRPAGRSAQPPT